jgi:hypothetical protein
MRPKRAFQSYPTLPLRLRSRRPRPSVRHVHENLVHRSIDASLTKDFWDFLGEKIWAAVPGLGPDPVAPQGKTTTRGGTVPPHGQRNGIAAVPSIQVGVKCIGNSITTAQQVGCEEAYQTPILGHILDDRSLVRRIKQIRIFRLSDPLPTLA